MAKTLGAFNDRATMRQLMILLLLSIYLDGFSTSVPPPNVRFKIINNTNDSISEIVQIQSDSEKFHDYDTFAIETCILTDEIHLYTERGKETKKFQKLIVKVGEKKYESTNFKLLANWKGYVLTINPNNIVLSKTNFFKRQKVISDLIVSFLIVLIFKGLVYLIGILRYIKRIYLELLIINLLYSIGLYYSIDIWFAGKIPYFSIILLLTLVIGFIEYLIIKRKLKIENTNPIMITALIGNLLSAMIGGVLIIFLKTFMGIIINVP